MRKCFSKTVPCSLEGLCVQINIFCITTSRTFNKYSLAGTSKVHCQVVSFVEGRSTDVPEVTNTCLTYTYLTVWLEYSVVDGIDIVVPEIHNKRRWFPQESKIKRKHLTNAGYRSISAIIHNRSTRIHASKNMHTYDKRNKNVTQKAVNKISLTHESFCLSRIVLGVIN